MTVVLSSNAEGDFFVVYCCVNQVSSYNTFYSDDTPAEGEAHSIHLRNADNNNCFMENMTKRIRPLFSSSSDLAFPSTFSNNMTSKGSMYEEFYFGSNQSAFLTASSLNRYAHVRSPCRTNNMNYTTLLHGIENRWELFEKLKKDDSVLFTKDSCFPPLKSASTYIGGGGDVIICQNQLYNNSFSINTQRQTKDSLVTTSHQLLAPILEVAMVDRTLNHLCCQWELKLKKNLSALESAS